jgi:hypothetical protein
MCERICTQPPPRSFDSYPRASGAGVALPIFEPILQAIWALEIAPKADGSRRSRRSREGFIEHFRIGADGKIKETQYQLASREAPSRPRKVSTRGNSSREMPNRCPRHDADNA